MYNWKNGDILNAENLNDAQNKLKEEIKKTLYPIGTIYKSEELLNLDDLLGGTWTIIDSEDLIDSGIKDGMNYKIYSNGNIEMWKTIFIPDTNPNAVEHFRIDYPFNVNDNYTFTQISLKTGGPYWGNCNVFFDKSTESYGTMAYFNNGQGVMKDVSVNVRITSKIDLSKYPNLKPKYTYVKESDEVI